MKLKNFYQSKKILVTGHTGFKGAWLTRMLMYLGADVLGYSLPPTEPSLYTEAQIYNDVNSIYNDIRDFDKLKKVFDDFNPDIVFHLAAQPIVSEGYKNPKYTYETNVLGTVNLFECIRLSDSVKSVVNVTTDKVYENNDLMDYSFKEDDKLNGYDPYSNSKSCSELVTQSYKKSFLNNISVSTARAGNVIGGGDFATDRIIPDCIRSVINNRQIKVRNPFSTRPYQHVLEPLLAYLLIAEMQYNNPSAQGNYNIGPDESDVIETSKLVDIFTKYWGNGASWVNEFVAGPHEAKYLKLSCEKIKNVIGWKPRWNIDIAIEKTVEWTKCWLKQDNVRNCMNIQIEEFLCKEL
jgi:CDP-glucose 4,6-dehydratase